MKTLYLRIYLTVVAVLLLFALVSGWLLQQNIQRERERFQSGGAARIAAWAELLQNALPGAEASAAEQARALLDWSERLRLPLAMDDAQGARIATSPSFARFVPTEESPPSGDPAAAREADRPPRLGAPPPPPDGEGFARGPQRVQLSDGRVLWLVRPGGPRRPDGRPPLLAEPPFVRGAGLVVTLVLLFVAVAAGAFPVVRRLTRRLEALKRGVETFGAGALHHRVDASGKDEVAAVADSFNRAASRIESLVVANQSLLANASHELRSPLARLKMAVEMLERAEGAQRVPLKAEIERNIRELDALVEEVLLASRLDARLDRSRGGVDERVREPVDLVALAAEEAARVGALLEVPGAGAAVPPDTVAGDERLLRRALRNLLENARRYGGSQPPELRLRRQGSRVEVDVLDRGPGVPAAERERIFEPFYRLPGHAEQAGGVGLGLSLVRQIARHHGGEVRCEARTGGGSAFVLSLPAGS